MKKYYNVQLTNPYQLLGVLVSTAVIFIVSIVCLREQLNSFVLQLLSASAITIVWFWFIKKKVVRRADFILKPDSLEWDDKTIHFDLVRSFKLTWMKGAILKLTLKDGRKIRLSANDAFCNVKPFVALCENLAKRLRSHNHGEVVREKSFGETKFGFYVTVALTVIIILIFIHAVFTDADLKLQTLGLLVSSLATLWSGIKWAKKA